MGLCSPLKDLRGEEGEAERDGCVSGITSFLAFPAFPVVLGFPAFMTFPAFPGFPAFALFCRLFLFSGFCGLSVFRKPSEP